MSTFNFTTANSNIVGKIDYSVNRTANRYTIKYEVFFRRTNSYSGTPTSGTIKYKIYIDGKTEIDSSKPFTITNNKEWCSLYSGSKKYTLNALATKKFTIGFSSTPSGSSPTGFNTNGTQTSGDNSVKAYATNAGVSQMQINFTEGNGFYTLTGTIGSNGTKNTVTGVEVYYTTNGSEPSNTNYSSHFPINNKAGTNWEKKIYIQQDTNLKAICYTLAPYGDIKGTVQSKAMKYYAQPSQPEILSLTYNTSKPAPNSTYIFSWAPSVDGYNNTIIGYRFSALVNDAFIVQQDLKLEDFVEDEKYYTDENGNYYAKLNGKELSLKKGDNLRFAVYAEGNSVYNNISMSGRSSPIQIESAGVLRIKIDDIWKEGQVWLKNEGTWKQATNVFIKDNNKWNSSI